MNKENLNLATVNMWGNNPQVSKTGVQGIYDTTTVRHGGYLVDITIHPKLGRYGEKTNIPNIRAFEEDYEALKVLWVYPELIKNPENARDWLTADNVIRYEANREFFNDFPECSLYKNGLENFKYNQGEEVLSIACKIIQNSKTKKIIEMCKQLEGEENYSNSAFDILTLRDNYKDSTLRYIPNYKEPLNLNYKFSCDEFKQIRNICDSLKREQEMEEHSR